MSKSGSDDGRDARDARGARDDGTDDARDGAPTSRGLDRRALIKGAGGVAGAALLLGGGGGRGEARAAEAPPPAAAAAPNAAATAPAGRKRRRYAIVGTGWRGSGMWGAELMQRHGDVLELVGLCDPNPKRAAAARARIGAAAASCPTFTAFDRMCDDAKPELVAVTTVDRFHSGYIVQALDRGIDVITEKPMVIDDDQCRAVLEAERRNGRKITVAFNYRYAPKHQKIKEVLLSGAIGRVISVDFSWYLDTDHGADYFRRWHRLRDKSGTLLVHKATHHFDLVNWWLAADPVEVTASARLAHYGKNGPYRASHCRACPHTKQCRFFTDIRKDPIKAALYVACEAADGYHRDGCVWSEDIDIYDTMSALVRYSNGAVMTYALNAFLPYEGYAIAFNGDKGRLDVRDYERQPWPVERETDIFLTRSFGARERIDVPRVAGNHGGGDDRLRDMIFRPDPNAPAHMRLPDSRAGAMSCLTGIAARKSVELGRAVKIADLVRI